MGLSKRNVTIRGDWEDRIFTGTLESDPALDGFWAEVKFKAHSNEGYITEVEIDKWASGYVDKDNNECVLSVPMEDLLENKIKAYIKNAVL